MEKKEIHIIDDDIGIFELLKDFFEDTSYFLTGSEHPKEGIEYIRNNKVEIVILDLMLPGMDGFEVCRKLREINEYLPIIMLTAKKSDIDKIVGLELGADDYLSKPFNPRELLARIKSILRRLERPDTVKDENNNFIYSPTWDIRMNIDSRKVTRNGKEIDLTTTEFNLLKSLMQNAGIVQSRDVLMDKVKGIDFNSYDRTIDVFISKIRQKINDDSKETVIIKTVRSIGYIFTEL